MVAISQPPAWNRCPVPPKTAKSLPLMPPMPAPEIKPAAPEPRHRYAMAPLFRNTLWGLYLALVGPLPLLAPPELRLALSLALALGMALLVAATSEQVEIDAAGIRVGHPAWCAWWLRRGWQLDWTSVRALVPVATSQGGRVYYVTTNQAPSDRQGQTHAYLLPQRLERFPDFLCRFSAATGLETGHVGRISPPWTYRLLALLTALMLLAELVGGGFWLLTPVS